MEDKGDEEKTKEGLVHGSLCLFWCIWKECNQRIRIFCKEEMPQQLELYGVGMGMKIATMLISFFWIGKTKENIKGKGGP